MRPSPRHSLRPSPRRAVALVVLLAVCAVSFLSPTADAAVPAGVRGDRFVDAAGQGVFLLGANYEGPADRAWQMWDDARFDAGLISRDFDRARAAGLAVLRVFVQQSLADDIRANRWNKLDQVLQLAQQRSLKLIVTLGDYPDARLENLAAVAGAVAIRYHGHPAILAYDLKNEPHFGDLALAQYPAGRYVALQDPGQVPLIGETIARADIADYRASDEGQSRVPARLSDDQAYVYANVLAAFLGYLADAQAWAGANDSTTVAYGMSPDSARWAPFRDAWNDTLATWIRLQLDPIRAGDPQATVTIGHVDAILASLPANNLLDYRTIHRYPPASSEGIALAMVLFRDVRAAIPGKALVLGEFGFANSAVAEDRSAQLEAELVRAVRDAGGAGALKWMLNDFPQGATPRENTLGMFRGDGTAKPVVASFRDLAALAPALPPAVARPPDFEIPSGHFFTQGTGRPVERDPSGYTVANTDGLPFWDVWQRLGPDALGYPISRRFTWNDQPTQVFQRGMLQGGPAGAVSIATAEMTARLSLFPSSVLVPEPAPSLAPPPPPVASPLLAPALAPPVTATPVPPTGLTPVVPIVSTPALPVAVTPGLPIVPTPLQP